jgi:hypothetical protein
VGRLLWLLVGAMLLGACQTDTHPVFSPSPSPTPHTQPTAAILQPADVPSSTRVCLGSGPIDLYLSTLTTTAPDVGAKDTDFWNQLLAQGAVAGAVSVYTADAAACSVELGATSRVKAITSVVVEFGDEGEADRAWQSGVFGFTPPPIGEVVSGITRGTTTGLGLSSFVYSRPPVALACWRRSVFVALVVVSNLDAAAFKVATAAIDPRLN